jgi:hypothetical protein
LPFLFGFVLVLICAVGLCILLDRFDLLPGDVFKTYRFRTKGGTPDKSEEPRRDESTIRFENDITRPGNHDDWYQDVQEGETITLPETALKKDDDE